jgi:hypothetical protein
MNNNVDSNRFYDAATEKYYETFRPYTPYVLISDDPDIVTDIQAIERYK